MDGLIPPHLRQGNGSPSMFPFYLREKNSPRTWGNDVIFTCHNAQSCTTDLLSVDKIHFPSLPAFIDGISLLQHFWLSVCIYDTK